MPTANTDIVKKLFALLQAGDAATALTYIDEDFKCVEAASLPYGGTYRGKAGFTQLMTLLGQTWNEFGFKIHGLVGEGDDVMVIETIWGTESGKRWEMPLVEHWKLRNGKVIEATPFYHDTGLLEKLHGARRAR